MESINNYQIKFILSVEINDCSNAHSSHRSKLQLQSSTPVPGAVCSHGEGETGDVGWRLQCACRWVGMSSFPWRMTPRCSFPVCSCSGETAWASCHEKAQPAGASGVLCPKGNSLFLPYDLFIDWLGLRTEQKKNMTLPHQFLKYLNYFFLPKSLASKTISIVNTLVLSLWKFNWIFSINTLYAYIYKENILEAVI